MPSSEANEVTMCYNGGQGEKEFVFSCKGRPFSCLTSPNFPTPPATFIDYNLVRDLRLRMTDLQCAKLLYGGQKMRILGKISTTVQCIADGSPAGNMHIKAMVVQDLYTSFDTHSIAGSKLSEKLIGQPFKLIISNDDDESTEPTEKEKVKKKVKPKQKLKTKLKNESSLPPTNTPANDSSDTDSSAPMSPSPRCQGKWIHHQYYRGWHPELGYDKNEKKHRYENRKTGSVTFDKPDRFKSDGSFHSAGSASSLHTTDEYDSDDYTNVSTIRINTVEMPIPLAPFGPTEARQFSISQLRDRRQVFDGGQNIPKRLQEVPIPHGIDWCNADCLYQGEDNLPPECGYHPAFGNIPNCSARCPGGWCQHVRQMPGRDFMS